MENVLKFILIGILTLVGIAFIITVGYIFTIIYAMGFFDKDYSVPDLKDNFEKNKIEMYELKKFFNEIVPKNRFVMIEYTDNHTLLRFGIYNLNSTKSEDNSPLFFERDLTQISH